MADYANIYRQTSHDEEPDVSSLDVPTEPGQPVAVVGVLPHRAAVWPRTAEDARKLRDWAEAWRKQLTGGER